MSAAGNDPGSSPPRWPRRWPGRRPTAWPPSSSARSATTALADVARQAAAGGVGWVLLNREASYLPALRAEFPGVPIFGVTPDQTQIGRIQAEQVRAAASRRRRRSCA